MAEERKSLQEVALEACRIMSDHAEAYHYDRGFDSGEFSGPAHDRAVEREIRILAETNGLTCDDVYDEVLRLANKEGE